MMVKNINQWQLNPHCYVRTGQCLSSKYDILNLYSKMIKTIISIKQKIWDNYRFTINFIIHIYQLKIIIINLLPQLSFTRTNLYIISKFSWLILF